MARKKRSATAGAQIMQSRTEPPEEPEAEQPRADPDQPPDEGTTGRPSVYSAWLNGPPPAPTTPAEQEEAATPSQPTPLNPWEASSLAFGVAAPPDPAPQAPPAVKGQPSARSRPSSQARRLAATDRLALDPQALDKLTSTSAPAPPPDALSAAAMTGPQTLPGKRADTPAASSRRATGGRLPSTLGETAARLPSAARPSGGRTPLPQATTTGRRPIPRTSAPRPTRTRKTDRPALDSAPTPAQLAIVSQDTAAALPAVPGAASSVLIRGTRHAVPSGRIVPRRAGPTSLAAQGFVALAMVVVLLAAFTVSSPLGYGAAVSGTIQAYANAVVPTPTPTATPTPVPGFSDTWSAPPSPGQQAVINEIAAVFGSYTTGALNVARCESGFDPAARNPFAVGNSHAEGVFQILYPSTWFTTSYAAQNPYDANTNIHAAWQIFSRDGYSWREWQCQP